MKISKIQLEEALRDYMKKPVHFTVFAERLGLKLAFDAYNS